MWYTINFDIPLGFKIFQLLALVFFWLNRKMFKEYHSCLILWMIFLQTFLNIYLFIEDEFLGKPISNYSQLLVTLVFIFISGTIILVYHYKLMSSKNKKFQKTLVILYLGFLVFCLFYYSLQGLMRFQILLFLVAVLFIFLSITNFFLNFIESPEVIALRTYMPFWISIGLLIVYIGVIPVLILGKSMSLNLYFMFYYGMQALGYSVLILGMLNIKRENDRRL